MARLALCAAGLALAAPSAASAAGARGVLAAGDATVLVQTGRVRARARDVEQEEEQLWEVPGGLPDEAGYAFQRFETGELVEGKAKSGRWVPCIVQGRAPMNLWNIHVSDEFPGYELSNVPASLLRRQLKPGQSDWFVDNSWLHHSGKGIKYRYEKSLANKSVDYAPWGTLLVGSDEGDGWLRTASGYVPMEVNGVPVLLRREREESAPVSLPTEFARAEEREQQALQPKDPTPAPLAWSSGDQVEFRSKAGVWYPARVVGRGGYPDTYHVAVHGDELTTYPVSNVHASRLRRAAAAPAHVPQAGESPMCQKEGCLLVRVQTSLGKEILLHLSKAMKLEMLMKMSCNRVKVEWESCKGRSTFTFRGRSVDPSAHVAESGLSDNDVVDMALAGPAPRDPVDALLDSAA